jgi:hypothetical protein
VKRKGHLEKLISAPIADPSGVNVCESEREQSRIIRGQFGGVRREPTGIVVKNPGAASFIVPNQVSGKSQSSQSIASAAYAAS